MAEIPGGDISSVTFFIKGDEHVLSASKVKVTNAETTTRTSSYEGGINDSHLGTTESWRCTTCRNVKDDCPGHFGSLHLNYPIFQPFFEKKILYWLRIICPECSHLAYAVNPAFHTPPKRDILKRYVRAARNNANSIGICQNCQSPKYKIAAKKDNPTILFYQKKSEITGKTDEVMLYPHEVKAIFDKIPNETIIMLGRNLESHPKYMIITEMVVSPNSVRPDKKKLGTGKTGSNTATTALQEIVRINMGVPTAIPAVLSDEYLLKVRELNGVIYDMMRKGAGPAKTKHRSIAGRQKSIISFAAKIPGKEGFMRHNLLGKRVIRMIRAVITANVNIKNNEIGVPINFCHKIQIKEQVTPFNYVRLNARFKNGTAAYPGASMFIKPNGVEYSIIAGSTKYLEVGDIICRDLEEGDIVNFNRQPSLTTSSILAHKVVVKPPGNTIEMNPSICAFYHADFDGDSMNIQIPPTLSAMVEIMILCDMSRYFIAFTNAAPQIGEIQDAIIGLSEMTRNGVKLTRDRMMQLFATVDVYPDLPIQETYTGHEVISALFAYHNLHFNYKRTPSWYMPAFKSLINYNDKDIEVIIEDGVLKQGIIDKKSVGDGAGTIFHFIANNYSSSKAMDLIFEMQQLGIQFNMTSGATLGLKDIDIPDASVRKIHEAESRILEQIDNLNAKLQEGKLVPPLGVSVKTYFEELTRKALSFGDDLMQPVIEGLDASHNSFLKMVMTGARGKIEHVRSSLSAIGQLSLAGDRTPTTLAGRSMACYPRNYLNPLSRGFTADSYRAGMTQQAFYFHSMESRISLITIQLQTSVSGTEERKSVKNFDSSIVNNVRQVTKGTKIIQFVAGGDGVDSRYLESIKCHTAAADLSNADFESKYHVIVSEKDIDTTVQQIFDDEFSVLKKDRDFFRKTLLNFEYDTDDFYNNAGMIAVPLMQLYDDLKPVVPINKYTLDDSVKSVIMVNNFLKRIPSIFYNSTYDGPISKPFKAATKLFRIIFRSWFCGANLSKRCIDPESLEMILQKTELHYKRSLVEYGLAIGVITAHSISQPLTQQALDSKNVSGLTVKKRGLKQFQEIVSAATPDKMQLPSMTLRLKNETDELHAKAVANKIEMMNLQMFTKSWHIVPESIHKLHPKFAEHQKYVGEFITLNKNFQPPNDIIKIAIVFAINKVALIQKQMSMVTIYTKLQLAFPDIYFVYTNENQEETFLRAYIRLTKVTKNLSKEYITKIKDNLLSATIRGIPRIKKAVAMSRKKNMLMPDGTIKMLEMYEIITDGTNFEAIIMNVPELDLLRCMTNNVVESFEIFGADIARRKVSSELRKQVTESLPRFHDHYAEEMVSSGRLTSIERYGLSAREYKNVLLRMSESDPLAVITEAADNNITDTLMSLSAYTVMGQIPRCGSSMNKLVEIDEEAVDDLTAALG